MALQIKSGSFIHPATPQDIVVSDVGFTPDVLFIYSVDSTSGEGLGTAIRYTYGVSTGVGEEYSVSLGMSNSNSSNQGRYIGPFVDVRISIPGSVTEREGVLKSFDVSGFTITYTKVSGGASTCHYVAIKGGTWKAGIHTGSGKVEVGFQPTGLISEMISPNPDPGLTAHTFNRGVCDSALNQIYTNLASTTGIQKSSYSDTRGVGGVVSASSNSLVDLYNITGIDATGFTYGKVLGTDMTGHNGYLAFKDVSANVGSFNIETATAIQQVSGVGFTPEVVFFTGSSGVTDQVATAQQPFYFNSVSDVVSTVVIGGTAKEGGSNGASRYSSTSNILYATDGSNLTTTTAEASLQSLDADGFTLNNTKLGSRPFIVSYIALADAGSPVTRSSPLFFGQDF